MTKERDELETDFTKDSKSCQPPCTEQFFTQRPKQLNDYFSINQSFFSALTNISFQRFVPA